MTKTEMVKTTKLLNELTKADLREVHDTKIVSDLHEAMKKADSMFFGYHATGQRIFEKDVMGEKTLGDGTVVKQN